MIMSWRTVSHLSFLQQSPRPQGWSNQDLAEFYRVEAALGRAGFPIEFERGLSDEGDPWCVFCRSDSGDVIVHFAKIGARCIAASPVLNVVLSGASFSAIISEFLETVPTVVDTPRSQRNSKLFLHPSAIFSAFVAAAFYLSATTKHADAQGVADSHRLDKSITTISDNSDEGNNSLFDDIRDILTKTTVITAIVAAIEIAFHAQTTNADRSAALGITMGQNLEFHVSDGNKRQIELKAEDETTIGASGTNSLARGNESDIENAAADNETRPDIALSAKKFTDIQDTYLPSKQPQGDVPAYNTGFETLGRHISASSEADHEPEVQQAYAVERPGRLQLNTPSQSGREATSAPQGDLRIDSGRQAISDFALLSNRLRESGFDENIYRGHSLVLQNAAGELATFSRIEATVGSYVNGRSTVVNTHDSQLLIETTRAVTSDNGTTTSTAAQPQTTEIDPYGTEPFDIVSRFIASDTDIFFVNDSGTMVIFDKSDVRDLNVDVKMLSWRVSDDVIISIVGSSQTIDHLVSLHVAA